MLVVAGQDGQVVLFPLGQLVVAGGLLAVGALAAGAGHHIDGAPPVGSFQIPGGDGGHVGVPVGVVQRPEGTGRPLLFQHGLEAGHIFLAAVGAVLVKAVQPGGGADFKPGIPEPLLHVGHAAGVHIPRAGAALDHTAHAVAEQRQLAAVRRQGQHAVVFQKHHALGGNAPHAGEIPFFPFAHLGRCGRKNLGHTGPPIHGICLVTRAAARYREGAAVAGKWFRCCRRHGRCR